MEIKSLVFNTFKRTVENAPINSEMKRSILEHPKVRATVQHMYNELLQANALQISRRGKGFRKETLQDAVKDLTLLFIRNLKTAILKRAGNETSPDKVSGSGPTSN